MLRTPCYDWHVAHKARMVDFAGWEMPVQYTTIVEEHQAVRSFAGLFDISHMGRLQFSGPQAMQLLDSLVTNDVSKLSEGRIRYALVTNTHGGILDDVLVYRFRDVYLMVVNAANRQKILDWIEQHRDGFEVSVEDLTFERCMFAVQGPRAVDILNPLCNVDIAQLRYYRGGEYELEATPVILSRTGYTGEDGFEVIAPAADGPVLWEKVIEQGEPLGLVPAGLGCRDTLRLEAGMPLYGHELDETIDPFTADLGFAVKLQAGDFVGKEALLTAKEDTNRLRRIGLELTGRRIAREGSVLFSGAAQVGQVTSGTFSPTLGKSIAMAYVSPEYADVDRELEVEIRGKRQRARVVGLPFYTRR